MKSYRLALFFLGLVQATAAPAVEAQSPVPECEEQPASVASTWQGIADALKEPAKAPRWIDLKLILDARTSEDAVQVTTMNAGVLARANLERVSDLYYASIGFKSGSEFKPARSYQEAFAQLRSASSSLSHEDKLLFLSRLGEKLVRGYDSTMKPFTSFEQIFKNAQAGGRYGGNCRDIHSYLVKVAEALGFDAVGQFSGLQAEGNKGAAHQVSYFRDKKTGEFYVQNYGVILNTHQKSLTSAIDIGTRALGPITTASYVESLPGRTHLYVPKASRWIMSEISSVAEFKDQPVFSAKISQREQAFGVQLSKDFGDEKIKGFYLHSDYSATDGPYKIDVVGVAGKIEKKKEIQGSVLDEIGVLAEAHLGYLRIEDRVFLKPERMQTRDNLAIGLDVAGHARIDSVTGKLEIKAQTLDINLKKTRYSINAGGVSNEITAGVEYRSKDLPVTVEASRTAFVGPSRMRDLNAGLVTAYDKLNVIVDTRGKERKVYLESDSRLYALDGVERLSAVGLQQILKAAIPAGKAGDFSVVLDASAIVAKRAVEGGKKDPFYDVPLRTSAKAEWRKKVAQFTELGAEGSYTRGGDAFYLFESPGSAAPDLKKRKKHDIAGSVWLHFTY